MLKSSVRGFRSCSVTSMEAMENDTNIVRHDIENQICDLLGRRISQIAADITSNRLAAVTEDANDLIDMLHQLNRTLCVENVIALVQHAVSILDVRTVPSTLDPPGGIPLSDSDEESVPGCATAAHVSRGRPSIAIPEETLRYLVMNGFSSRDIAHYLGISIRTVKRRLNLFGIQIRSKYWEAPDEILENKVKEIIDEFPNIGYKSVIGHLMSQGYCVQEWRVRQAMREIDPVGVLLRRLHLRTTHRRRYSVRAPQALWHIDGYHKLIRWRFVIHGGMDGYSRLVVFLTVSTNNYAETVLQSFLHACEEYGLPERVRSDKGGENVLVAEHMLNQRGPGSHIAGRSVHNQRIERFWRDLWCGAASLFYNLFYHLEDVQLLNPLDEMHLKVLHYVFVPRMQIHLNKFVEALKHRPLRTEHGKTPNQLWIGGQVTDQNWEAPQDDDLPDDDDAYGIDDDGPTPNTLEETVAVPDVEVSDDISNVLQNIDPLRYSNNFGMDIYTEALELVLNG